MVSESSSLSQYRLCNPDRSKFLHSNMFGFVERNHITGTVPFGGCLYCC